MPPSISLPDSSSYLNTGSVVAERSHSTGMVRAQAVAAPAAEPAEHASSDIHGFELERQQWVAEYNSTVLLYRHKKTG